MNTHRQHESMENTDDDLEADEFGDLQGADQNDGSTDARIAQGAAKKLA